jgi:hypothetical protein
MVPLELPYFPEMEKLAVAPPLRPITLAALSNMLRACDAFWPKDNVDTKANNNVIIKLFFIFYPV